jgi:ribonuclease G
VVNQLRLRDIGGIIVIDFIDMARARNRDAVMKTLRKTLDEDRTKTFTAEISKLGLVEMTRQNVTEGVREIMSRPCPTCEGEGVIRSEETIAIEFERKLRDVAAEHPEDDAFLVQMNPRVSTQFTGHSSRVLHALEAQTGKSFLFEGSEGLGLEHFAITFTGTREQVEERALPFRQGDEVLVEIVEPHMYDVEDAVAKIDGYIISIAGAAPHVGEKRMVRIVTVGRTAASALLLDEAGEVVRPSPRPAGTKTAAPSRRRAAPEPQERATVTEGSKSHARGRRRPAESEDAEARREAGLSESPTTLDSEPEEETATSSGAAEQSPEGAGGDDGLQSKPRRRGRRGGRRRSAAKAKATPE